MDQLDMDAKAASDMRVSYGKYIALFKGKAVPVVQPKRRKSAAEKPTRPLCVICGQEIPERSGRKKTCGAACADILRTQNYRETGRRRRQKKMENNL